MRKLLCILLVAPLISCALLPGGMRTLPPETQIAHEAVIVQTALLSIQTTIISLNEAKIITDPVTRQTLDYIKQVNTIAGLLKGALETWHLYGTSGAATSLFDSYKRAVKDLKAGMPATALQNLNIMANLKALLAAYGG